MIEFVISSQMDVGIPESVQSSRDGLRKNECTDEEGAAAKDDVGVEEGEEEVMAETERTGLVLVERRGRDAGRGVRGGGGGMREEERRR